MSTNFTLTSEQLLEILDGEEFYSVMLQDTVSIQKGKVICKNTKLIIPNPTHSLLESLTDEMFINTFQCYPTEENIKNIFKQITGESMENWLKDA